MNPDPTLRTSFWAVCIGSSLLGLAQSGYEQTQIQRYCTLPTIKKAKTLVLQVNNQKQLRCGQLCSHVWLAIT